MMTTNARTLTITTPSDREIAMTRVFDAPRHLVYEAFTTPELVRRWLGVFGGWSLVTCEMDVRVGGRYRWEWSKPGVKSMGVSGVYREVVRPERLVATEQFDEPWYEGEGLGTTTFVEAGGQTTMIQTMRYTSREVRDAVLRSPMEKGVSASYDKLAEVLATQTSQ
jgi:uncharacterized protein YndB with AHSA1/START domain